MKPLNQERLYNLLPAIYRQRDLAQGEPLRALMAVIESEFQALETDIEALYDNWFIETCDEWAVPYLADLVGVSDLTDEKHLLVSQRRRVANTVGYRRRKGTVAVLEQVIADVTGWPVRVVEFFQHLATTQHMNHVRPGQGGFLDLRQAATLTGPFDTAAHTIDVRQPGPDSAETAQRREHLQGKYNLTHIGVFLWRLQSYTINSSPARAVSRDRETERALPPGCFTFDSLGRDLPLFNRPRSRPALAQRVQAINLPLPLNLEAFAADLKAYQARYSHTPPEERPPDSQFYGPDSGLHIVVNGEPVPPLAVVGMNLSQWPDLTDVAHISESEKVVAVDVNLGRLVFLGQQKPAKTGAVEVTYAYGFSADIGGGPYHRGHTLADSTAATWQIEVSKGSQVNTLQKALARWDDYRQGNNQSPSGVIRILDSGVYGGRDLAVNLSAGSQLVIEAADGVRPGIRPVGNLTITGHHSRAKLRLNGLLIDSKIEVENSLDLEIRHCTLMPGGLEARGDQAALTALQVSITHSIIGPLRLPACMEGLSVQDSILDSDSGYVIAAPGGDDSPGPPTTLERVTVFGKVKVQALKLASEVIFTAPVTAQEQQTGLVRFSYVPPGSQTPRRDHCQPDLALTQRASALGIRLEGLDKTEETLLLARLRPVFTSTRYGDPAYAQLSRRCPDQIRRGAADGSEMGVFHQLHQPMREDNLRPVLNEYLPFGLEAGIITVT